MYSVLLFIFVIAPSHCISTNDHVTVCILFFFFFLIFFFILIQITLRMYSYQQLLGEVVYSVSSCENDLVYDLVSLCV